MITVGTQKDTSRKAAEVAATHDNVWAIVGLHPIHLFDSRIDEEETTFSGREEVFDVDYYRNLIQEFKGKVVGLGECGLDYYHRPDDIDQEEFVERQADCFRAHLDLAHELDLPVMVHCRDAHPEAVIVAKESHEDGQLPSGYLAHPDVIAILKDRVEQGKPIKGNIHCFTGTWEEAQAYLDLGLHISFTGIITFPPRKKDLKAGLLPASELACRLPLGRILVETDAPYLTPVPHRGEWPNEPAYVEFVSDELAKIHGVSKEEMERITLDNTVKLFGLS